MPSVMCAPRRLKSVSDQSLRCQHEEALHPWIFKLHPVNFAQSDLNLRWADVSEGMLSDLAAYIYLVFYAFSLQRNVTFIKKVYSSICPLCR